MERRPVEEDERVRIAEKLVKWCKLFYKRVEAAVETGHGMTQWFEVEGGLHSREVCSALCCTPSS